MTGQKRLRQYHAAVWDEPVVMEMGRPGARGQIFSTPEPEVTAAVGEPAARIPASMRRAAPPPLPEITEFEAQRHYLHLSQMTLGMMGVSLFGTCTMKYNAKVAEMMTNRPELAEVQKRLRGELYTWMNESDDFMKGAVGKVFWPARAARKLGE